MGEPGDGLLPGKVELARYGAVSMGEVVIVNDGSTDRTKEIAEAAARADSRVVVVHHSTNLGMGATVRTGYGVSRGIFVTQLPADGQVGPETLATLLPHLDQVDAVFSVYAHRKDGMMRKALSAGFQGFTRVLYRQNGAITGTMMIRRSLVGLFPTHANTFFANLELPFRLMRAGVPYAMVEIEARPRTSGGSKVANPGRIMRVVREMVRIRLRQW
jgi:glycosyltransferase involved in cell wall biosynthesis